MSARPALSPASESESREVIAEVSIGGRPYVGRGTLVDGLEPVLIAKLTPRPALPPFARIDAEDLIPEVADA